MECSFEALSPFGVEAAGLEMGQANTKEIWAAKSALANHGVMVLREQADGDAEFVAFLQKLGPVTFTVGETPVPDAPDLNIVTNVGRSRPPRSVFHTDTSYIANPPAFTALRVVTVPDSGGETLFSNQYWAYETLPSWVKQQLARSQVLHVVSGLTLNDSQEKQSWHPLFKRHPVSGRTALFLSTPERCQQLSGLGEAESQRAIRLLYRHSIRPRRLYRHRWRAGDVVIWDDRCTMHKADHSQVVGDRVLHRGLVAVR